ncbi:MAG: F0F1 ATP synthase subunit B [Chloroflexi bacterium]|nr:F0F1 ATP synthase subunit B [Chloroflexota bacterium]
MDKLFGSLGIEASVLLVQIVNFALLFGLLYLAAYKPIMRLLDERSKKIKEGLEQAETIKTQAAAADEAVRMKLEEAGKEGESRIARASKAGEEIKTQAQVEAKKEAEALVARALVEIQQERDEAVAELRKEFADLTVLAAEKVVERTLDKKGQREIIQKILEENTKIKGSN